MALTSTGRAVLTGSAGAYAAGWLLGYHELWVVATTGVILVVAAVAWTAVGRRVEVERAVAPSRVVRGDIAEARVTLTNPSRWPMWSLRAEDQVGAHTVESRLPTVAARGSTRGGYRLPTTRRGVTTVGPLRIVRDDPLGLVRRARQMGGTETLWVYPRIHPLSPLPAGRQRDLEGPTHDGASGSITFHTLREYVVGDDLRLVHWRSTARTGTLMVRQQADPSRPQADLVLDTSRLAYPDEESFESAVEAVASLAAASTRRRFPVRLHAGTTLLTAAARVGSGPDGASRLLDHLTTVETTTEAPLGPIASRLARGAGGHSLVVVTGTATQAEMAAIDALRHRYAAMAVVRFDVRRAPGVTWADGLTTVNAPSMERFAALWARLP